MFESSLTALPGMELANLACSNLAAVPDFSGTTFTAFSLQCLAVAMAPPGFSGTVWSLHQLDSRLSRTRQGTPPKSRRRASPGSTRGRPRACPWPALPSPVAWASAGASQPRQRVANLPRPVVRLQAQAQHVVAAHQLPDPVRAVERVQVCASRTEALHESPIYFDVFVDDL